MKTRNPRIITKAFLLGALAAAVLQTPNVRAGNLTWNLGGNGTWNTSTANWTGDSTVYTDGDNVTFNNAAGGTITVSGTESPGSVTVSANAGTYTLSGSAGSSIGGSGGLLKSGSGALAIGIVNSYTGATQISGSGAITVTSALQNGGVNSAIGASSNAASNLVIQGSVGTSATGLIINATSTTDRLFTIGASATIRTGANVSFTNTGAIAFVTPNVASLLTLVNGSSTLTFSFAPQITDNGSGKVSVSINGGQGGGTFLTGTTSTFTGTFTSTQSGGIIHVAKLANGNQASSIGAATSAATNFVRTGGDIIQYIGAGDSSDRNYQISGNSNKNVTWDASGSGALILSGTASWISAGANSGGTPIAFTLTGSSASNLLNAYNGAIVDNISSGTVALTKNGSSTWVLGGSNTYTGATSVLNGALRVNGSLGNTAVTVSGTTTGLTPILGGGNSSLTGGSLVTLGNSPSRQVYASSNTVGSISGNVTIGGTSAPGSAGHLAPGNSVGTLTVGSLTLSGGSILDYEFNGSANDFTVVAGALNISGSSAVNVNLFQEGGTNQFTAAGTYDLFQYGSLTGSVSNLSVLNPNVANNYVFGTTTVSGTNYVTLTISSTGGGATSTTYTLTANAGSTNILTGGTTGISSTIQNTGSGSADTLNYTGLTATSGSGGTITGSSTSGGPLAQSASGTNSGLTFTGTHSGVVTVTAVGSGTNATLNTAASQTGTNTATVTVWDAAGLSASQSGSNMQVGNLSGSFRASAKITSDGGLTNNQGFVNVNVNGQQINSGSSITVANFDSTGKLNGTYSATKNLGYDNVTTSGSAITGGTGNTANLTLTATVSGQTAGAGQVLGAPVFSGQKYGTTTVGGTSSGFGLTSNISSDPHSPTTATIINGTASANTTVLMSFDKVPAGSEPDSAFRVSDILTLSGLVKTGGTGHDGSTLTDIYVLQLSYDSTATGQKYLGWYDATQNQWVNAVAGNSTGGTYDGTGEYAGSYASYLSTLSVPDQTNLAAQLGAFGYDSVTHTAWAVVDHESEFAVIPEPGTWGMIVGGFGMLIGIQRLRRRRVGT